jgi:hypothetical protein
MLDADTYHWSTGRRAGGWGRKRVGSYPVMMRIIQGDLSDRAWSISCESI